jgi:hypothetical protein
MRRQLNNPLAFQLDKLTILSWQLLIGLANSPNVRGRPVGKKITAPTSEPTRGEKKEPSEWGELFFPSSARSLVRVAAVSGIFCIFSSFALHAGKKKVWADPREKKLLRRPTSRPEREKKNPAAGRVEAREKKEPSEWGELFFSLFGSLTGAGCCRL